MIPSANSAAHQAGDLSWHSVETWPDQGLHAASSSIEAAAYSFRPSRQQDWDWESAMILAQHSANACVGDQDGEYKPTIMQAEPMGSISNVRQFDGLLSTAGINPSHLNLSNNSNTWGLLNTVGARNSGGLHDSSTSFQALPSAYYSNTLGASGMNGYGGANTAGLYGDPRSLLGLVSLDHRRLQDIVKREPCTTADFNARIGLNLGGRTYFSADDYAFGRFGKRLRPNSPGAQAPLCQAEGCKADLSIAKHYHRRHKVCAFHSKAATVIIAGQTQRFCQQCSRFHVLSEFDDGKRSCRKRLADHNRRRRKPQPNPSTTTTDQTTAQKNNESEDAKGSENLSNGSQSKGSPTTEQPLAAEEGKGHVSELSEDTDQKESNHNFMEGNRSGPSLSLTTLGEGVTTPGQSPGETYGGVDLSLPWLRAASSRNNIMETLVTRSDGSPKSHISMGKADPSTSLQNLLPLQASRDRVASSDWVINKGVATKQGSDKIEDFNPPSLGQGGKSDGNDVFRLLERGNERNGNVTDKHAVHATFGFLDQTLPSPTSVNGTSSSPLITGSRPAINFSGLQDLRPLTRSIYSSDSMI